MALNVALHSIAALALLAAPATQQAPVPSSAAISPNDSAAPSPAPEDTLTTPPAPQPGDPVTVPVIDDDLAPTTPVAHDQPTDADAPRLVIPRATLHHVAPRPLPRPTSDTPPASQPTLPSAAGPIDPTTTQRIIARLVQLHWLNSATDAQDAGQLTAAIKAYQGSVGIPPTGLLDGDTIGMLGS